MGGEEPEVGPTSDLITGVPFGLPSVAVLEREPPQHLLRREVVRHTPQIEVDRVPVLDSAEVPVLPSSPPPPAPPVGRLDPPSSDTTSSTSLPFVPPEPVPLAVIEPDPPTARGSWPFPARILGGLLAVSLAAVGLLVVAARSGSGSVLAERVARSLGMDDASPDDLADGVDAVVDARDNAIAQLSEARAAQQATVKELEQTSAERDAAVADRNAAAAELSGYQSVFPLSVDDLQGGAADFTSSTLTMAATPRVDGCLGMTIEGCTTQHTPRSITFAIQWDATAGWTLSGPAYSSIPLSLDAATGTLSGAAPVTLGWTCADGSTGQPGTATISMRPTRWARGDATHHLRATAYTGELAEDGGADGTCAFSGLRWTFQLAE